MAEFGSVVAEVRASLDGLDRDLAEARKRLKTFYSDASRMAATIHAGGTLSMGVGPDAGFRRIETARQQAEAEQRRFMATQEAAARENARRIQETARSFFGRQSGLSAVGGGIGGGPGSFIAPASMRGLDETSSKWLKHQQAIAKAREEVGSFRDQLGRLAKGALSEAADKAKQFASAAAAVGTATIIGGVTALAAEAIQVNSSYQRGRIALAEILSLTTDLTDKQGHVVTGAKAMAANYAEASNLIKQVRQEAQRTTLTTQELLTAVEQSAAFAIRGGATTAQLVPLVAQVSNLAKSLGAEGETQIGHELRAVLTGQMLSRSRIGRALGLDRQDVENAQKAGKIVEYLNSVLQRGKPFLDDYARSWAGITTTLQSKFQELVRQSTEKVFDRLTHSLVDLNKVFSEDQISRWASRFAEAIAQITERAQMLAGLPIWKTLRDNLGFLVFDQGEATLRELAERRAARGPERTSVEIARLAVGEHRRSLEAAQTAASGRAFTAASRAGFTAAMVPQFVSPADARAIEVQRRELERVQRQEMAAEDALRQAHIRNELQKTQASAEHFRRVSRMEAESNQKAKEDAENERIDVAKRLADLTENKIASLRAEAEAEVREVNSSVKREDDRAKLIKAIRQKLARDVAAERQEEADQERDAAEKSVDLAHRVREAQDSAQQERVRAAKEFIELQRQTQREGQQLLRQRADSERELVRAQQDRLSSIIRFGQLERRERQQRTELIPLPGGRFGRISLDQAVTRPGTPGIEGERENLLQQSRQLFAGGNIRSLIVGALQRRGQTPELAAAEAEAQLRQLSEAAVRPQGLDEVNSILRGFGVTSLSPGLQRSLQGIQARGVGLSNQEAALADQERQRSLQRAREDQGRGVEDARRSLRDLTERQAELVKTYRESVQTLREGFNKQTQEAADRMRTLAEEAQKLARSLASTHVRFPADLRAVLASMMGTSGGLGPRQTSPALAPIYQITFGPGSLQVRDLSAAELKRAVSELLQREARNAAPPRR